MPRGANTRRNIITYFSAFLTGDGASQVQAVAVAWSVYSIHHRAFDLGLVGIVMFAPSLLLVFVAGHVADRYDRKRIVLTAAIAEAICSLVLAGLAFAHVRDLLAFLGVLFAIAPVASFIVLAMLGPSRDRAAPR